MPTTGKGPGISLGIHVAPGEVLSPRRRRQTGKGLTFAYKFSSSGESWEGSVDSRAFMVSFGMVLAGQIESLCSGRTTKPSGAITAKIVAAGIVAAQRRGSRPEL